MRTILFFLKYYEQRTDLVSLNSFLNQETNWLVIQRVQSLGQGDFKRLPPWGKGKDVRMQPLRTVKCVDGNKNTTADFSFNLTHQSPLPGSFTL